MKRSLILGLVHGAAILGVVVLGVVIAWAADILTVDKDGTVRLRMMDSGAAAITASDNINPGLKVTQGGSASAVAASGRISASGRTIPLSGLVSKTASSTAVTGNGDAKFLTELTAGDRIEIPGGAVERRIVTAVNSDSSATVHVSFNNTAVDQVSSVTQTINVLEHADGGFVPAVIWRQTPAVAANNQSTQLMYLSSNDAGSVVVGGAMRFNMKDVAAGLEDTDFQIDLVRDGVYTSNVFDIQGNTGNVGIGTGNPDSTLELSGASAAISLNENSSTPASPASGAEARIYMKGDKLVIQYNDAGTVRYKYLDLTGIGVTWVQTTTAP